MLRANPALVQLNGYSDEQAMLDDVNRAEQRLVCAARPPGRVPGAAGARRLRARLRLRGGAPLRPATPLGERERPRGVRPAGAAALLRRHGRGHQRAHAGRAGAAAERGALEAGAGQRRGRRVGLEPGDRRGIRVAAHQGHVRLHRRRAGAACAGAGRADPPGRRGPDAGRPPGALRRPHRPLPQRTPHPLQGWVLEVGALARHGDRTRRRRPAAAHGGHAHGHHRTQAGRGAAAGAGDAAARVAKDGGHRHPGRRRGARLQQLAGRHPGQPGPGARRRGAGLTPPRKAWPRSTARRSARASWCSRSWPSAGARRRSCSASH